MALVKCKECGHEISDKADNCPNCGAPNPSTKSKEKKGCATGCGSGALKVLGIIVGIGVLVSIAAQFGSEQTHSSSTTEHQEQPASSSSSQQQEDEWYVVGTLHDAGALDWQQARYENKLATCGDILFTYWENDRLVSRIANDLHNPDDARVWADSLVIMLDIAMEPMDDPEANRRVYANQDVAGMAVIVLETSNWTR